MYIKFKTLEFKNILSYGSILNKINFDKGLFGITGKNGFGKCLDSNTRIDVEITNKETLKKFNKFIENRKSLP
jgi:hypothetical protein